LFQQALTIYQSNGVQHMVHRIRRDARLIDRYQNNRDFVAFINAFADRTQPLPTGWQQMMVSGGGVDQIVFVDHTQRKTTLFDPRLPYRPVFATGGARRRTRSAPNGRSGATQNVNLLGVSQENLHSFASTRVLIVCRRRTTTMAM
jgi:hypothetical protein